MNGNDCAFFFENFIKLEKVYIVNFIFVNINKSKKVF